MIDKLIGYWESKRPSPELLPSRRAIDPVELRGLVAHIVLYDVIGGGEDFVCRLAGTAVEELYGRPLKGFSVARFETGHPEWIDVLASFRAAVSDRKPSQRRYCLHLFNREFATFDRILLPLATDGQVVDCLLGGYWRVD